MAYDLSYFSRTYNSTTRANGSSQAMLNRWPFLCSRPALRRALQEAGMGASNIRNFQDLTYDELTDKIIDLFDQFMYDNWVNYYTPKCFDTAVDAGYRWDQDNFWIYGNTSFIFHDGNGAGVGIYVLDNVEIVLLPGGYQFYNQAEYKHKPFLGFDNKKTKSTFAAELDLDGSNRIIDLTNSLVSAGSFVIGESYNIREVGDTDWIAIGATSGTFNEQFVATGVGSGTGKARETDGTMVDHQNNPTGWSESSFMFAYDFSYYHSTLGPNGSNSSYWYGSTPADWNNLTIDSRYYSKAYAAFATVVGTDGKIQSIYEVARQDGDGNNLYGGWGYNSSHHRQTLTWFWDANGDGTLTPLGEGWNGTDYVKAPVVLIDTTYDHRATDYSGNEARILFPQPQYDYYEGKNLPIGETLYGYAAYGLTGTDAYDNPPEALPDYSTGVWERSWPYYGVQPSSVRIVDERPAITATTRSLNTHTVGTGAQRYSFEFEYPPMTYEEAREMIAVYEKAKGTSESIRVGIPNTAMKTIQSVFYKAPLYKASNTIKVTGGTTGATDLTLEGLEPNSRDIREGVFFAGFDNNNNQKIYQIIETQTADDWGRQNVRVYPPLRGPIYNLQARTPSGNHSGIWFLIAAYLIDDSFEYTVDAAGLYRISIRFTEALN